MSERKIPLPLRPLVYRCDTFMPNEETYDSTTVIVVPTKIGDHGDYWTIKWSCSRGAKCRNTFCVYSARNRGEG